MYIRVPRTPMYTIHVHPSTPCATRTYNGIPLQTPIAQHIPHMDPTIPLKYPKQNLERPHIPNSIIVIIIIIISSSSSTIINHCYYSTAGCPEQVPSG